MVTHLAKSIVEEQFPIDGKQRWDDETDKD